MTKEFTVQYYDCLTEASRQLREEIFVQEQGFQEEFDEVDAAAWHVVVYAGLEAIATGRVFPGEQKGTYVLGRICVKKAYRHAQVGSLLMQALEAKAQELGAQSLTLAAQVRAKAFYERNGYVAEGPEFPEEGCPHIQMNKSLS